MRLSFLGAASTVTGSQFLLEHDRIAPAYDPRSIDALLLTHAHLDHCGLIPLMHARGLGAPIFTTAGTMELAALVLLDSAKLQEEFAERRQRRPRDAGDDEETAGDTHAHGEVRDPERAIIAQVPHATTSIDLPLYTV